MDEYFIPQYLDEPYKIALLTIDEIIALVGPTVAGLLIFNSPIYGLLIGMTAVGLLKKFKGEEGHYYLLHLLYWHFPTIFRLRTTPSSDVREILG